jgi:transglutaminase-like putative cysteine protease
MPTVKNITDLLPYLPRSTFPRDGSWGGIPMPKNQFPLEDIIKQQYDFQIRLLEFSNSRVEGPSSGDGYERYLQFPNASIQKLANEIVDHGDSNDEKMFKILMWVINNIKYVSDLTNYGKQEYWALPTETIQKGSGDCEDGAFLIHSLALHAGVPHNRLRTYGGYVRMGEDNYQLGGHGWTSYKRETDNEWVVLDWCYYPSATPIEDRVPMSENYKYVDDMFYVSAFKTVETPYSNRIRNPNTYSFKGGIVNKYI